MHTESTPVTKSRIPSTKKATACTQGDRTLPATSRLSINVQKKKKHALITGGRLHAVGPKGEDIIEMATLNTDTGSSGKSHYEENETGLGDIFVEPSVTTLLGNIPKTICLYIDQENPYQLRLNETPEGTLELHFSMIEHIIFNVDLKTYINEINKLKLPPPRKIILLTAILSVTPLLPVTEGKFVIEHHPQKLQPMCCTFHWDDPIDDQFTALQCRPCLQVLMSTETVRVILTMWEQKVLHFHNFVQSTQDEPKYSDHHIPRSELILN